MQVGETVRRMRHPQPVSKSQSSTVSADTAHSIVQHHYRLPTARLSIGMWVADLDRPWTDTPFLIQGFIIDTQTELASLRKFCRHVYVDLHKSNGDVAASIRESEQLEDEDTDFRARGQFASLREPNSAQPDRADRKGSLPASGAFRVKVDATPSQRSQQRFREFVRTSNDRSSDHSDPGAPIWERLWARIMGRVTGRSATRMQRTADVSKRQVQTEMVRNLPPGTKLVRYTNRREVQEELPRARITLKSGEVTLKNVLSDIRAGVIPDVGKVQGAVDDMVDSMISNPDAMMWIARLRDEDTTTYSHGVRVSLYMMLLGRHLGFPKEQLSQLGMIGMLADVGKLEVPRALLEKPGMLTNNELDQVKQHVEASIKSLKGSGKLPAEVEMGIAQHHERMDGGGYPSGLKGDEISIYGRIAGIADCFTALVTSRPYANAQAPQDALLNLYHWAGTSFHEALVEQFVQAIGVFPVGSMVELSSGELAVVIAQNRVRRLEPKVLLLTWPDKRPLASPIEKDLFQAEPDENGKRLRIARGLPSGAFGLKLRDYYADSIAHANNLV